MSGLTLLLLLSYSALYVSGHEFCQTQDLSLVEKGRECRKSCVSHEDCNAANKGCYCDGYCGLTCFNKQSTCGEPEGTENGHVTRNHILWGGIAYYTCNDGFAMNGTDVRVCNADKRWGGKPPTCQRGCTRPDEPEDSYPTNGETAFIVGQSYEFSCNSGFFMRGNASRTCISIGEGWSPARYSCTIQHCDPIPSVPHGEIIQTMGTRFGSTATVQCHEGYETSSTVRSMKCFPGETNSKYGEWKGTLPTCTIINCGKPVPPLNGFIKDADYIVPNYGSIIAYGCDRGFKIKGPKTASCNKNKKWGERPSCIETIDCDFDEYSNPTCGYDAYGWTRIRTTEHSGYEGHVAKSTEYNSSLISIRLPPGWAPRFLCLKFHYRIPNALSPGKTLLSVNGENDTYWQSHERETTGQWLDSTAVIDVRSGIRITFHASQPSVYLDDVFASPEECDDHCADMPCRNGGTCVNRISSYTCFCPLDFTGNQCEIDRKCKEPSFKIPNGYLSFKSSGLLMPGSTAIYYCDDNYKFSQENAIVQKKTIDCVWESLKSRWSIDPLSLSCEEITCPDPIVRDNARLTNRKDVWLVGDMAQFSCDRGFESWDPETLQRMTTTITCKRDGQWSGNSPYCIMPYCTFDEAMHSGPSVVDSNNKCIVGESIRLKCKKGHEIRGDATLTCVAMQSWDKDIPICQKISCGKAPDLENGEFQRKTGLFFEENFEYTGCVSGYYLQGSQRIACRFDGTFSRVPECRRVKSCDDGFLSIEHGNFNKENNEVTFSCHKMYRLVGEETISCRPDGIWSHPTPFCEELPASERKILEGKEYLLFLQSSLKTTFSNAQMRCQSIHATVPAKISGKLRKSLSDMLKSSTEEYKLYLAGGWSCKECVIRKKYRRHVRFDFKYACVGCDEIYSFACERDFDPCLINPCGNGGACSAVDEGTRTCTCARGFKGPNCHQEIVCDLPRLHRNVIIYNKQLIKSDKLRIGSKLSLTCNDGYRLEGSETITCQYNGRWSDETQWCRAVKCSKPKLPKKVIILSPTRTSYASGTEITLGCEAGYKYAGYPVATCGLLGVWSNIASCEEVLCDPPALPENSVTFGDPLSEYVVGASVRLSCGAGYVPKGTTHITCLENGSWQNLPLFSCERKQTSTPPSTTTTTQAASQCTKPDLPDSVYIVGNPNVFLSGTNITLGCLNDRSAQGDPKWQCQNGEWRKTDFRCVVEFCVIDEFLMSSGVQVEDFSFKNLAGRNFIVGKEITLSCSGSAVPVHYEDADTEPRIVCQSGGQWSPFYGDFDCKDI